MSGDVHSLADLWRQVGSAGLCELTEWTKRRPTFVEGIEGHRLAWEARRQTHA
jgi:hypothetical protein